MCIVALAAGLHPDWPLVVAANRDERHDRPAEPLAIWPSGIVAGRDAVAGGTWLGVHPAGRFAALTNVAGNGAADPAAPTRGALVPAFLDKGRRPDTREARAFNAFNLLGWAAGEGTVWSNRGMAGERRVTRGLLVLGNAPVEEAFARSTRLRPSLGQALAAMRDPRDLFAVMGPDGTGAPEAAFLIDPVYGTRCTTVVAVDRGGAGLIAERRFDAAARIAGETTIGFVWPPGALPPR